MKWVTTLDSAMTQVVIDPMWLSSVFDLRKHEIALHDYTKSSLYYSQEKKNLNLLNPLFVVVFIHSFIWLIIYFYTNFIFSQIYKLPVLFNL